MLRLDHAYQKLVTYSDAEDLDIAMLIYNLLEYSDNYTMTPENLRNYYRDELNECCQ